MVFAYPSFNKRFVCILFLVLALFAAVGYYLIFVDTRFTELNIQIEVINTLIQTAALILGIFAAYYALRQLVETRFTELDKAGGLELRDKKYLRAFLKWREAFYVRPDANVFLNASESLLLMGDYENFDKYISTSDRRTFLGNGILTEDEDRVIVFHLKALRNLLVKNQGEAEKYIEEIIPLFKSGGIPRSWNFSDFQTSIRYLSLEGECKEIADNLIQYLQNQLQADVKEHFEAGRYAYETPPIPTNTTPVT